MKNFLFFVTIVLFVFVGCKKSSNPVDPVSSNDKLVINMKNLNAGEQAWAVLHSLDGKNTISQKSLTQNSSNDFGSISGNKITLSFIDKYSSSDGWTYIEISSFFNCSAGEWNFINGSYHGEPLGSANVTINYPYNLYDNTLMSIINNGYVGYYDYLPTEWTQTASYNYTINSLPTNGKLTIFGSATRRSGDSCFCGWLTDQNFIPNSTNNYTINLTRLMQSKNISLSEAFNRYTLLALVGSDYNSVGMSCNLSSSSGLNSSMNVSYCDSFPKQKYLLSLAKGDASTYKSYSYISSQVPSSLTIPVIGVTFSYNQDSVRFENIVLQGTIDYILIQWYYSDASTKKNFLWSCYVPINYVNITRPIIPPEILNQIPEFNPALLRPYAVWVKDYDTASSLDDYIKMIYKSSKNAFEQYNICTSFRRLN